MLLSTTRAVLTILKFALALQPIVLELMGQWLASLLTYFPPPQRHRLQDTMRPIQTHRIPARSAATLTHGKDMRLIGLQPPREKSL
jgi:hypothetical protein